MQSTGFLRDVPQVLVRKICSSLRATIFLLATFLAAWLVFAPTVLAENIVVNSLETDVTCTTAKCTLPGAIRKSQQNDTPSVVPDTITFSVTGTINLLTPLDTIITSLDISGPGPDKLTVQRSYAPNTPNFGIFTMSQGATPAIIGISGLTIQNGSWLSNTTFVDGGGVYNLNSTTNLNNVVITGNQAYKGGGGVKNEQGRMTIRNSVVANNKAFGNFCREDGWGGGILAEGGQTLIDNVTVFNNVGNRGGGIYINGDNNNPAHIVTVTNSTIISNIANTIVPGTPVPPGQSTLCKQASWGGGIGVGSGSYSYIYSSLITGNVSYSGGGMFSENGTIVISNSAVLSNTAIRESTRACAQRNGGGGGYSKVSHGSNGPLIIVNSTIATNKSPDCAGGGIFTADEFLYLLNSTVTANTAKTTGGGFVNSAGSTQFFIKNSIVSGNSAASLPETDGDVISQGYNIIGNTTNIGWVASDRLAVTNLGFTPLQPNGGSTPNYGLLSTSPALNTGDPAGCTFYNGTAYVPLLQDQRGFGRPSGGRCDVGAVESQAFVLDLNGPAKPGTSYTTGLVENSPAVTLTDPALIAYTDAPQVLTVTIRLTNPQDTTAESLLAATTGTAITANYDSGTATLLLTGADSLDNYKNVLQSVKYANSSDNPGSTPRTVSFSGTSSYGAGATVTATVVITPVNDAPVFNLPPQLTAREGMTATVAGLSLADPDAASGTLSVTLSVANGRLSFGNSTGLIFQGGVQSGASLVFSGTLTNLNTALATLIYSPTQAYFSGLVSFTLMANDFGNSGTGGPLTANLSQNLNVLSALLVTNATDNGTTTPADFGTLSYALAAATDSNRTVKLVSFVDSLNSLTLTTGVTYNVAPGVTLQGRCGANGAEVELVGNGTNSLVLNGGVILHGLNLRGLPLRASPGNASNKFSCLKISR